jgi:hypothetical protein
MVGVTGGREVEPGAGGGAVEEAGLGLAMLAHAFLSVMTATQPANGTTFSAPSMVQDGDSVVIAGQGRRRQAACALGSE